MKVAVLGLGAMGAPIARRLEAFELTVYNRTPRPADLRARVATTPADAAAGADVVVTMLADGDAVAAVLLGEGAGGEGTRGAAADGEGVRGAVAGGALAADPAPRVVVDMSTIDVATSERIAAAARAAGVGYLRAPVSGNPSVVEAGNLTILASGDPGTLEAARPVLEAIGPTIFHVGEGEEARVMKLALNVMVAGTMQLIAEALALGERHGLDRARMLEVINGSVVGSPFTRYKSAPLVADDYTTTFAAHLMRKDLGLALDGGVPLPVTTTVQQRLDGCIEAGMGDLDFSVLVQLACTSSSAIT